MTEFTTTASPEGRLIISLQARQQDVAVDMLSERPLHACRIFEGKSIAETLRLFPMLFSVCGQAQSVAAIRAIENATLTYASNEVEQRRNLLISLEGIREHLWRILMDWPQLLGGRSDAGVFAPLNRHISKLLTLANPKLAITTQAGLQQSLEPLSQTFRALWQNVSDTALTHLFSDPHFKLEGGHVPDDCEAGRLLRVLENKGWSQLGNMSLEPLPELPNDSLAQIITGTQSDRFIRSPEWQNLCFETGPFSRQKNQPVIQASIKQYGSGAHSRMLARLVELVHMIGLVDAELSGVSMFRAKRDPKAHGIAQVEAVRGRLIHYVELDGDSIFRYRVVAPTEWNFHNNGIVKQMLSSLEYTDTQRLTAEARLLIQLIDPCVGYSLEAKEAPRKVTRHA